MKFSTAFVHKSQQLDSYLFEDPKIINMIRNYQLGDDSLADELLRMYEPFIKYMVKSNWNTIMGAGNKDFQDYDDVMQYLRYEFIKILKRYDPNQAKLMTFLSTSLKGLIKNISMKGRNKITENTHPVDPQDAKNLFEDTYKEKHKNPVDNLIFNEEIARILDNREKDIITKVFIEQKPINEVAKYLANQDGRNVPYSIQYVYNIINNIRSKIQDNGLDKLFVTSQEAPAPGTGISITVNPQDHPELFDGAHSEAPVKKKKKKKKESFITEFHFNKCVAILKEAQVLNADNVLKGIIGEAALSVVNDIRNKPQAGEQLINNDNYLADKLITSLDNWTNPAAAYNEYGVGDVNDVSTSLSKDKVLVNKIRTTIMQNIDQFIVVLKDKINVYINQHNMLQPSEAPVDTTKQTVTINQPESILAGNHSGWGGYSD